MPAERKILHAALELHDKTAADVMTPLNKCFMLDINSQIDQNLMKKIYSEGYSRIPIFEGSRDNIVGILMANDLIMMNIDINIVTIKQIQSIIVRDVLLIDKSTRIQPIMSYFKKGDTHMGIVTKVINREGKDPDIKKVGIITLEDIIEELL